MRSGVVSVILPCYNAGDYVSIAVQSILDQTYQDLEILAIDDGSTDATLERLKSLAARDCRVRILENGANRGLIATLNRGLDEASGAFIARMDADDRSHPGRIEAQVSALGRRDDCGVVGTQAVAVDGDGRALRKMPLRCVEPAAAAFLSLFATPILHPTMLARSEVMSRYRYSTVASSLHTEDYELFARMIRGGVGFLNIAEVLYDYRIWPGRVSERFEREQVENFAVTARAHLGEMLDVVLDASAHRALINRMDRSCSPLALATALHQLDMLRRRFQASVPTTGMGGDEVLRIADEQRLDILLQALLKGGFTQRTAASALALRYLPRLLSAHSRRYLIGKLSRPAG